MRAAVLQAMQALMLGISGFGQELPMANGGFEEAPLPSLAEETRGPTIPW